MVPMDRAVTSSYRKLSIIANIHVVISSGLAAIFNAKLLLASISHERRITVNYYRVLAFSVAHYSSVNTACIKM